MGNKYHYPGNGHGVPAEARFAHYCLITENCWLWMGGKDRDGYGMFSVDGHHIRATKYSYQLFKGPVPDDKFVCHTCDNPSCVNPVHLWLGTAKDNSEDSWRKGRQKPLRGDDHSWTVIKDADVPDIRMRYHHGESLAALATEFGVDKKTIHCIVIGKNRKLLDGPIAKTGLCGEANRSSVLKNESVHLIRLLAATGIAHKKIAEQFGIDQSTASAIIRREKWSHLWSPYPLPKERAKQPLLKLTEELIAEIVGLQTSGLTQKQVAERYGISQPRVGQLWRANPRGHRTKSPSPNREKVQQILALREEGFTYQQIAERVGINAATAWAIVRRK